MRQGLASVIPSVDADFVSARMPKAGNTQRLPFPAPAYTDEITWRIRLRQTSNPLTFRARQYLIRFKDHRQALEPVSACPYRLCISGVRLFFTSSFALCLKTFQENTVY